MVEMLGELSLSPVGRSHLQEGEQSPPGWFDSGVSPNPVSDETFTHYVFVHSRLDVPPQGVQVVHCCQGICCGFRHFAGVYRRSEQTEVFSSCNHNCGLSTEVQVVGGICVLFLAAGAVQPHREVSVPSPFSD